MSMVVFVLSLWHSFSAWKPQNMVQDTSASTQLHRTVAQGWVPEQPHWINFRLMSGTADTFEGSGTWSTRLDTSHMTTWHLITWPSVLPWLIIRWTTFPGQLSVSWSGSAPCEHVAQIQYVLQSSDVNISILELNSVGPFGCPYIKSNSRHVMGDFRDITNLPKFIKTITRFHRLMTVTLTVPYRSVRVSQPERATWLHWHLLLPPWS